MKSTILLISILFAIALTFSDCTSTVPADCNKVCHNGGHLYGCSCVCIGGWTGDNCETCDTICEPGYVKDEDLCLCICQPDTCYNGGSWNQEDCKCDCPEGTYGSNCEYGDTADVRDNELRYEIKNWAGGVYWPYEIINYDHDDLRDEKWEASAGGSIPFNLRSRGHKHQLTMDWYPALGVGESGCPDDFVVTLFSEPEGEFKADCVWGKIVVSEFSDTSELWNASFEMKLVKRNNQQDTFWINDGVMRYEGL